MGYRLGIDIGGTFTDFVLIEDGTDALRFGKVLTTPDDPTDAILAGLAEVTAAAGVSPAQVEAVVHGTTLVTNAVIERKGETCVLLTTAGFEDILEIGREMRYDIYDLFMDTPEPLVPRNLRLGVPERVGATGEVVQPLDLERLDQLLRQAVDQGAKSAAVCYLHAFVNPSHERQTRDFIRARYPDLYVSLSSEILPEIREYERASATVMNAYVQPITERYLSRLARRLADAGFGGVIHIMLSSGRLTTLDGAIAAPIHLLESGPAGGCMASGFFGKDLGRDELLCFDMGGTTAKAALIHGGKPDITNRFEAGRVRRFKRGSGLPVRIPVIDMIEIGAGGGSLAVADSLGLLKVGPASAGSEPGPACYGRGGDRPTVTDADLVLGYLNPDYFLGGAMALDVEAARRAIDAHVAEPLGLTTIEAAMGIHRVVNENMAGAARVHILEKGKDPRRYTMLAFGGAGPVHAFQAACLLGVRRLVVPVGAGVASALGFLVSPVASAYSRGRQHRLDADDWQSVNQALAEMEGQGRAFLAEAGVDAGSVAVKRLAEMRYIGQGHEVTVAAPAGRFDATTAEILHREFERAYRARYNRALDGVAVEAVTWRVVAQGPTPDLRPRQAASGAGGQALRGTRMVHLPGGDGPVAIPVYDRYALRAGSVVHGPAIIEEKESTFVASGPCRIQVDECMNLAVDIEYGDDRDESSQAL